ncbi:Glutathione S-transferase [Salinihabitans flavidus]|uniref:Glutathione S-transferase n=1 Tax=Salinihabitans flavidus TaxID=569882 RepID=A0A1H8NHW4_9RHOB|nr:glutathione S-transferase [Salinihabitans flavidus]SEO29321.1 Glutathione S-transferase [Salinihabitans flavidus]
MIFYDCATAPSPRRARMFIAEKGLTPETREISIAAGEQLVPEFLAVNPRATVPVLVTRDGTALTENLAIATYLEESHPHPPLMGEGAEEKAAVMMWTAICETQGGQPIAETLRNSNPHMRGRALPGPVDYDQIPELAERGRARVAQFYDLLEDRLTGRDFLATDRFTLADITGYVFCDFARVIRMRVDDTHPALKRWYDAIGARPSAAL